MLTIEEAEAQGFTVDTCCYPPFAYKGPRFRPDQYVHCFTQCESELRAALDVARNRVEQLERARRVDTLTVSHYVANMALSQLWDMLGANNQTEATQKLRELLQTEG